MRSPLDLCAVLLVLGVSSSAGKLQCDSVPQDADMSMLLYVPALALKNNNAIYIIHHNMPA